uniref:N-acetyltransferase domain-containing protein n=1 Tax=Ditylenchus dipsaci TaxID=166011 RepID=A0A915DXL1_9BILA
MSTKFWASTVEDAEDRFRHLLDIVPPNRSFFRDWMQKAEKSKDPLYFVVIDLKTGKIGGKQTWLRIDTDNGVIEIGHIYWGPLLSRKPAATEAMYLFMKYAFEELGYRRYEWKCHSLNVRSRRAAERFGLSFEGIFRQDKVTKGRSRDTAWYACIDKEWPMLKAAYNQWLSPDNFDQSGVQIKKLEDFYVR